MTSKKEDKGGISSNLEHGQKAARFMAFRKTLDQVNKSRSDINVVGLVKDLIYKSRESDTNCKWVTHLKDGADSGNPRAGVPSIITKAINSLVEKGTKVEWKPVDRAKVPLTWFVCYYRDIIPDKSDKGWEWFECSHRCINNKCVYYRHLVWESASVNQSRGHYASLCKRECNHCGRNLCKCQKIHKPHCI